MKKAKSIAAFIMAVIFATGLCACGGDAEESSQAGDGGAKTETVYKVGDTWEVEGQWKFTVDNVTVTDERNEFEESDPAQVIIVEYHYENIGYKDESGLMSGLFLDVGMAQQIDAEGNMCSEYPLGSIEAMPQETPVGAKCTAQTAIGLKAAGGPVKIMIEQYDSNSDLQSATFELEF